ncbi:branched-chain amino acid transporter permease [Streptomyces azureus]|uniref:Branched-chain amino acid transport n=1 Tax=Streptomyces azureus TaxID=146537 RepID=A0A0K8PK63_STRAJ|nr:AzlD domain-containing protein [Streptomyces azureus]GAP48280.1 branched-chain amino acid transport [Streptomyces azureus]
MPDTSYLLMAILVMAAVTFALRAAPFVLLSKYTDSPLLDYLRVSLPPGIMVILVAYSLHDVDFTQAPYGLPALIGTAVCAGVYHWRRSPLSAIVLGTGTNMALLHLL